MNRKRRREWACALAFCLAMAAVMLLFASQSSPLYPINDWVDANCLLTVGRVMRAGGVVYRDIYEQKGPTLYLLHALAACVSDSGFLGVYLMETLSLAAALFAAYRLFRLRAGRAWSLGGAAVWGAIVLISPSFCKGDSAEEFCLPLLMAAMAVAYAEYGRRGKPMRPAWLALCGVLAGLIFTIKYTLLGAMLGLCLCEGVLALREGGLRRAFKSAGVFLAGMVVPILLWVIYFAVNGALGDAVTAYLTNNIFLYGDGALTLAEHVKEIARYMRQNALWVIPAAEGMGILLCDMGDTRRAAVHAGDAAGAGRYGSAAGARLAVQSACACAVCRNRHHAGASAGVSRRISEKEQSAVRADAWSLRAESGGGVAAHAERLSARAEAGKHRAGASGGVY